MKMHHEILITQSILWATFLYTYDDIYNNFSSVDFNGRLEFCLKWVSFSMDSNIVLIKELKIKKGCSLT